MRYLPVLLTVSSLLLAVAALGQDETKNQNDVVEALKAKGGPVLLSDLPDGVRAVTLSAGDTVEFGQWGLLGLTLLDQKGKSNEGRARLLLSLIGTNLVDPTEFAALIEGRRPRILSYSMDIASFFEMDRGSLSSVSLPPPRFLVTWIEAKRIVQWTPRPEVTKEALVKAFGAPIVPTEEESRMLAMQKLSRVMAGIAKYAGDNGGRYPKGDSSEAVRKDLLPYLETPDAWASANPLGGRLLFNTRLSGRPRFVENLPEERLLLWDEKPWPDGGRTVMYSGNNQKYVTAEEWEKNVWPIELHRRKFEREKSSGLKGKNGA